MLLVLAVALGRAQTPPPGKSTLTADDGGVRQGDETVLTGHARLRDVDLELTADQLRYNEATDTITATGHVVYTRGPMRLLAQKVILHRQQRTFTATSIRLGEYPYFIEGSSAQGNRDAVTVMHARITYGEPGPWQPTATADVLTFEPETKRIRSEGALVGVGQVQPLPFPKFQQSLADPLLSLVRLTAGYRGELGAFVDGGLRLPVAPGLRLGGDIGYYTARGLLVGPSGSYANPDDPGQLHGEFHSGYINDHGDKKTDVLGRPVPENRGFFAWQHQQTIDDLSLTGVLNYWKDSEVVRDFRPREFFPVQQPDNFVEATYAHPNWFVSAFVRYSPNSFQIVQQRLPEVRFDLLPTALPGGFVERFNASVAVLREDPLFDGSFGFPTPGGVVPTWATPPQSNAAVVQFTTNPPWTTWSPYPAGTLDRLQSTRVDAYYGLSRPIAPNAWFTLTPVVGGRFTNYSGTEGAPRPGGYTRTVGEIGADVEFRSSGTFNYRNEAWHIDGLRHLFTPKLSYRYIPDAEKGQAYIPAIDRDTFSTYLQPLGLGDVRNIDQLHSTNTLRLELDNVLQTHDAQGGTRDLLTFNVANDFRFKRQPGQKDVSEIHTELAAMPARWLEFGLYNSFAPQSFTLREFNSGITIHDGRAWTVRFANNFLRHQLQDYLVDARARLNEEYDVLAQLRYDQRRHRFTEQSYGIVQNLANTWRISYLVSFYSGRRRESGFGLSVQVDTVRF